MRTTNSLGALYIEAESVLIKWRRNWERQYTEPPTEDAGWKDELRLWKIAGKLMELRGIKRRMPG